MQSILYEKTFQFPSNQFKITSYRSVGSKMIFSVLAAGRRNGSCNFFNLFSLTFANSRRENCRCNIKLNEIRTQVVSNLNRKQKELNVGKV